MPYNFSNAPASFHGYINKILAKKLDTLVIVYLDEILIYIKDPGQPHVNKVRWVLKQLRKHGFFTFLKKWYFYQNEIHFLRFILLVQALSMEEENIEPIKAWPESKLIKNIQVFLRIANFYQRFIQGFSKISALLTSILKTSSNGASPMAINTFSFLTPEAMLGFFRLRQAFTKALIFHHFDSKRYNRIETDASGYAIGGILSQLKPKSG